MADWNPKANEIFLGAAQIASPAERHAFLDEQCADAELRRQVESLLAANANAGSFLNEPAVAAPVATVDESPISEGPGTIIGPYKLLQRLGEGGFGVVFMAEQLQPVRRKVALKIIKPGMDTKAVIARFEAERQALALMDHPNIAKVLDAGATGEPGGGAGEPGGVSPRRPFFVMELVKGVPITEFCDKNHMRAEERLKLFLDVCHAIQHAHHKGVIHRDVKPSNVMITLHDGVPVVKVIDFGVAKATAQKLTERTLFTAYGQMVGTPAYMSPEQAEMSGLDIDTRSDVYSLGVLLYELLTGTTPLDVKRLREAGYAEMQRLIREEEPPRPSTRLSSLGDSATVLAGNRGMDVNRLVQFLAGDLDWIVMKALEKDRNRRYGTPGNFAEDVERYLRREAILARPPSTIYKLRKFVERNRTAVGVASGALFLLVVAIAGISLGLARALQAEQRARDDEVRARDAEQLAASRLVEVGQERDAADKARAVAVASAGQLKLAVAQEDGLRLAAHSAAVRLANPGQALLLAIAGAQKSPSRSAPHNNALLNALRDWREERTLFALPFQTSEGRTGRTSFVALQVTPDGARAVVVGRRLHDPSADPYLARASDASAQVYDLQTGTIVADMKFPVRFATMAVSPDGSILAAASDQGAIVRYFDGQTVAYTDAAVRLWDMRTGKELRVLKGHADRVSSLCFDAKGELLLSASWDKTARIWDIATGRAVHVLDGGTQSLAFAEFSPDGRRALTVTTIQMMQGNRIAESLAGRTFRDRVRPDQVLIDPPVRADAAIRWLEPLLNMTSFGSHDWPAPGLWEVATGKRIALLTKGKEKSDAFDAPLCAGFSADGTRVVTAGVNKSEVWNAGDGKPALGVEPLREVPGQPLMDGDRVLRIVVDSTGYYGGSSHLLIWQSDKTRRQWRRSTVATHTATVGFSRSERMGPLFLEANRDGRPLMAKSIGEKSVCPRHGFW